LFQCNLVRILNEETWSGRLKSFSGTIWSALLYIFEHSYVSSVGSLTLLTASYSFVPSKLSRRRRAIIGGLHVLAHLTAALLLMLLLELGIEICIRNHLLATSGMPYHSVLPECLSHVMGQNSSESESFITIFFVGYHTLYEWYRSMESEHFPDPTGLRARLEQWTLGLYPACIKYLMAAFDVPEVIKFSGNVTVCLFGHSLRNGCAVLELTMIYFK
jgi:hypothetical protein